MIWNKTVLIVGDFIYPIYEQAFYRKFKEMCTQVHKFEINHYFSLNRKNKISELFIKFQYKYNIGPSLVRLNKDLISKVESIHPDIILFYRGKHIFPSTLKRIKVINKKGKLYNYNNDDPFSDIYPKYYWRLFKDGVNYYDHLFCYRGKNITDLDDLGVKSSSLLMPYYIKEENYQFNSYFQGRENDIVFIGHFERDGRDEYIKKLYDSGFRLRLFGTDWEKSKYYEFFKHINGKIPRLNHVEYNDMLNNSKIALVFMSKRNHDEYTRRCFEIPATGAVMLSEYTKSLDALFEDNKGIIFFKNPNELVEKAQLLISNPEFAKIISTNAKSKLIEGKHELTDRIIQVLTLGSD